MLKHFFLVKMRQVWGLTSSEGNESQDMTVFCFLGYLTSFAMSPLFVMASEPESFGAASFQLSGTSAVVCARSSVHSLSF